MKIVCAPDAYRDCLSAAHVVDAMVEGIARVDASVTVDRCPIADGGEGTVEALLQATGGQRIHTVGISGPTVRQDQRIRVTWGWMGGEAHTAILEMAEASGLALVPSGARNPLHTSTIGTGEMIRVALDAGATRVLLGLGGSGTCDGGCGAAQALGVRFETHKGRLERPITGADLRHLTAIDVRSRDARLDTVSLVGLYDVRNPLTGPQGAATLYSPQKGATPMEVEELEEGLCHLAALIARECGVSVHALSGAGAAGGLGAGMHALLGAGLEPGAETLLDRLQLDQRLATADLCLTGEGRLDAQTLFGKACAGVLSRAQRAAVPCVAIVGACDAQSAKTLGFSSILVAGEGLTRAQSILRAPERIAAAAQEALGAYRAVD